MTIIEITDRVGIVSWAGSAGAPLGAETLGVCPPCPPAFYTTDGSPSNHRPTT
jgi:hypothetical protein